jgi:two-component system CheB/CheR fusion protein
VPITTKQKMLCVLVVDDNTDHANSVSLLLENDGYDTHVCNDSLDCMAAVKRLRPDVVLLDLKMPGVTGYDIADQIKSESDLQHIRLVAITGFAMPLDRLQTQMRGFDHHLEKPIAFDDLEMILELIQDRKDEM